ncbi:hypothetical protein BJX70DRAFT_396161 [Aspergillus crustosus]
MSYLKTIGYCIWYFLLFGPLRAWLKVWYPGMYPERSLKYLLLQNRIERLEARVKALEQRETGAGRETHDLLKQLCPRLDTFAQQEEQVMRNTLDLITRQNEVMRRSNEMSEKATNVLASLAGCSKKFPK